MLHHLSRGEPYNHPLLEVPGWWKRSDRLLYPPVSCGHTLAEATTSVTDLRQQAESSGQTATYPLAHPATVLIAGATGTLGQAFARICERRGIPYRLLSRQEMDITSPTMVEQVLDEMRPWAVINAAGYVRVDDAERESDLCRRINADGAAILAENCAQRNIGLITFSSDLVFDGDRQQPYLESDPVAPLNVYGHSKAQAERWVLHHHPSSLVIRTSAFFGPWDDYNFLTIALRTLQAGQPFLAAEDAIVSPTYVPDLVHASLDLLIDGECGLWHLANPGAIAWVDLARQTAQLAGLDASFIQSCSIKSFGYAAPRPAYSVLSSERGVLLPDLDRAIAQYLHECDRVHG